MQTENKLSAEAEQLLCAMADAYEAGGRLSHQEWSFGQGGDQTLFRELAHEGLIIEEPTMFRWRFTDAGYRWAAARRRAARKARAMTPDRRDEVVRLAIDAGIPADVFDGWEGHELGLYRPGVQGARLETAQRAAEAKEARQDWGLDLGNRSVLISRAQGEALVDKLTAAGIAYAAREVVRDYIERTQGSSV